MVHATTRPIARSQSELEEEAAKGFEVLRHTELGQRLIAARASYLAEHGRFLTQEAFDREWARGRGAALDDEE